jgi:hypothetical protein
MASRKIVLKGTGIRNEDDAGAAITPGHLLTFDGSGDVIPHNVEGGIATSDFAVEEDFLGSDIDNAYAAADRVQHETLHVGQQVNAIVNPGTAAITKGDYLISDGNGGLESLDPILASSPTVASHAVIARALVAVDNSGGAAIARLVAEIV